MKAKPLTADDPRHGTRTGYTAHCKQGIPSPVSILDIWRRWLNTPQHMTATEWHRLNTTMVGQTVALAQRLAPATVDHMPDLTATHEGMAAATFGGRPCPDQLPHDLATTTGVETACPSCGAAL